MVASIIIDPIIYRRLKARQLHPNHNTYLKMIKQIRTHLLQNQNKRLTINEKVQNALLSFALSC